MAAMLLLGMWASAYLGFASLALSQGRHRKRATESSRLAALDIVRLRWLGAVLLIFSLVLAFSRDGASFGPILWILTLAFAGAAVIVRLALASP